MTAINYVFPRSCLARSYIVLGLYFWGMQLQKGLKHDFNLSHHPPLKHRQTNKQKKLTFSYLYPFYCFFCCFGSTISPSLSSPFMKQNRPGQTNKETNLFNKKKERGIQTLDSSLFRTVTVFMTRTIYQSAISPRPNLYFISYE